jgi:steroid 5-alpha reductase family enzyme
MLTTLLINIFLFVIILFTLVTLIFLYSAHKENMSVMDIAYGPLFAISAWSAIVITEGFYPLALLVATLITLWAIRLGIRIWRKNHGQPEDARYAAWRQRWMRQGRQYFLWRSYLQVNLFQGLIIGIIALPFIVTLSAGDAHGSWQTAVGALLMLFGLSYETTADWQLDRFLARKRAGTEPAPIMTTGLFRYSRRPNYFGEVVVWVGLATLAYPLPFGPWAVLSPLLIWYIVTRVTGPMLEKIFLEKYPENYRAYMEQTNYFIPGKPRA